MQHSHGSAGRPAKRPTHGSAVQPAHASPIPPETMICSLNIESARHRIRHRKHPTSLELMQDRCNGSRAALKKQFLQFLQSLDAEAARKQKTVQSGDRAHNMVNSIVNNIVAGTQQQQQQQSEEALKQQQSEEALKLQHDEETSSCDSVSTSTRKTPLSSGAEQDQEPSRSEPGQPEYLKRDEATCAVQGKTLKNEKQRQLQQTIHSQIQPTFQ